MSRARRRLGAALLALSAIAAACGGASDPTPAPTTVRDVVQDAANQSADIPLTGVVDQARDVAGDLDARNAGLDD